MLRAFFVLALAAAVALADPCPKCGQDVEKKWKFCPDCGQTLPDRDRIAREAALQAEEKKGELLVAMRRLKRAYEDAGDKERAAQVAEAINRIEGSPVAGGADPALPGGAKPVEGYRDRVEFRAQLLEGGGGTAETEAAVLSGLKWLARHQSADGSWSSQGFHARCAGKSCMGAGEEDYPAALTGLAILGFLGAGYTPQSTESWRDPQSGDEVSPGAVVRRGLTWLVRSQDAQGCIGSRMTARYMYSHAIGTMAMAEAAGMTGAESYLASARLAVDYLVSAQNPGRGWRYSARDGESDMSVTTWCVLALRAAARAGIDVPRESLAGAKAFVVEVTDEAYCKVGYNSKGTGKVVVPGKNDDWDDHPTMTAGGILCRMIAGADRTDPALDGGAKLLVCDLPAYAGKKVDYYYWHYGTMALHRFNAPDGKYWKAWVEALKNALVPAQRTGKNGCLEGSWDADVDRWGYEAGRVYVTALNTLTLETWYRDAKAPEKKPKRK